MSARGKVSAALAVGVMMAVASADAQRLRPRDVDALPSKPANARISYGSADPLQFGELRLPAGSGPFPLAIVIHGGCWISTLATLQNTAAMADALRDAGVATWNIEYRRADNAGGGWPGTFVDVAAAADFVPTLAKQYPLDLARVVAVGHSAGGHLALWLGGRRRLPADSPLASRSPLTLRGVIALGGPGDLRDFTTYGDRICGTGLEQLMGGSPAAVPERYAMASPRELLPLGTRQLLIVGEQDGVMPARSRDAYVAAARKAGDDAAVVVVPDAGHFEVIAPTSDAWPAVRKRILDMLNAGQH